MNCPTEAVSGRKTRSTGILPCVLLALVLLTGCSPGYLLRAGWAEAKILKSRRPIAEVVRDTATAADLRNKLRLVEDARAYAERELGLDPGDSFESYARVDSDTLLLVVSAAPRFRLTWKTWWFPIVGRVPYRGYFDFEEAHEEAHRLSERGYDTWVRPTAAFSTLGWLPDPVLSTTLSADSVRIVETVVHEITHTTYFPSGRADFNESFANFAGHMGAIDFYCRALRDEDGCETARARWHDTRVFGRFVTDLHDRLASLYARDIADSVMAERKAESLESASVRYRQEVAPTYRGGRGGSLDPDVLNNAWLLSRILYYRRLDDFEAVRERHADPAAAIAAVIEAARAAPDPWTGLDRLLSQTTRGPGTLRRPAGGSSADRADPRVP